MCNISKKDKIVKAFLDELSECGFENLNTNKVCARAGVSKGLLFHYYNTKDNLFIEVSKGFLDDIYDYYTKFDTSGKDFYLAMDMYIRDKLKFFNENPQYIKLFILLFFDLPQEFCEPLSAQIEKVMDIFRQKISELLNKLPLNKGVDVEKVIDLIFAMQYIVGKKYGTILINDNTNEHIIEDMISDFTNYLNMILTGIVVRED